MKRSRWISMFAVLLAGASASAQDSPAGESNLFGNDFPQMDGRVRFFNQAVTAKPATPAPQNQQTLIFSNGRQLRGELAEVTKDEILWRRKEASDVLRFPRAEVRRVLLVPPEKMSNRFGMNTEYAGSRKVATPPLATVKLPGGDWLRGALTSPDGQAFTLALKGGTPLQLAREQIEWLHFGQKPAPAFGLGEGPMALEGWLTSGLPRVESKDGTLTVHDVQWLGRMLATPSRFEVAFEVPAEGEEGLRIWIQPFNPQPNSYSSGTVQLTLGRKTLRWLVFHDSTQPNNVELPPEAQAESGPVRYRLLYDAAAQRFVVLRNGRQIGDWSLKPKVEQPGMDRQQRLPRGLCFDRQDRGQKFTLQFRRLSVLPWDGVVPAATDGATKEDRLSTPTPPPLVGRLGEVREKEIVFAGQTVPLDAETFVKFSPTPPPLTGTEALLSFGEQGDVSLADVLVSDGKVRGRSVFAPAFELPASALQSISFNSRPSAALPVGDQLVFKNGDEIAGALVSAVSDASLRWRLATGQEIDFQTDRIAGVRLTTAPKIGPAGAVELRSGERVRGSVVGFDEKQLRWKNELLGELAVDRARLWRLFPNLKQSLLDGGQDPTGWLRDLPNSQRFIYYNRVRKRDEAWLALDGRFILRARDGSGEQALGPTCELEAGIDRYELRVDLASPGENPGTLNLNFLASDDAGAVINLSSYEANIYVRNPKATNGGGVNRSLQIRDKIGDNIRQLSLRAFVNRPAGTIDLFLNGYNIGRVGLTPGERMPGLGNTIALDTYTYGRSQMILTNLTIAPWSGELPRFGDTAPVTVLANGDVAAGLPTALIDGRWRIDSEIGPLDLASDKVQAVEFGGEMQPTTSAGRLRLVDGSALLVDRFEWTGSELTAHHVVFGDLRLPASAVSELIYEPAPVRPATVADPKKVAKKENDPFIRR